MKRKLTAARLGAAIRRACENPSFAARATALGAELRADNGAMRAADRVLHHVGARS